jgi:hypothetical protein
MDVNGMRPCDGKDFCQDSSLHTDSIGYNSIGAAGAWDLGAALQVNTTLTTLK